MLWLLSGWKAPRWTKWYPHKRWETTASMAAENIRPLEAGEQGKDGSDSRVGSKSQGATGSMHTP